jgi:hypothetical protein
MRYSAVWMRVATKGPAIMESPIGAWGWSEGEHAERRARARRARFMRI